MKRHSLIKLSNAHNKKHHIEFMFVPRKKACQAALTAASRRKHSAPSRELPTSSQSNMKAYAFGLVPNDTNPQSKDLLNPFGGKVLAQQSTRNALYKENIDTFRSAFVYEFPSLPDAIRWRQAQVENRESKEEEAKQTENGLMVIEESEDLNQTFTGYSVFFINILDKISFAKYDPTQSLEKYKHKRIATPIAKAAGASRSAHSFDAAVLIAFDTPDHGKTWLESQEYRPHGELRMRTTSGHGIVIGRTRKLD